jgi:hypothetical protein
MNRIYPEEKSAELAHCLKTYFGDRPFDASSIICADHPNLPDKLAFLGVRTTRYRDLNRSDISKIDKWLRRYAVGRQFGNLCVKELRFGWIVIPSSNSPQPTVE